MADWNATQITTKVSPRSVTDTVSRLTGLLAAKGVKVFAVIDQTAEASQVGMQLRADDAGGVRQPGGGHAGDGSRAPGRPWTYRSKC